MTRKQLHGTSRVRITTYAPVADSPQCEGDEYTNNPGMDDYTAIAIAEGVEKADSPEQVLEAWQHLVNTGLAWTLQGWFGRTATQLIEQGAIRAPEGD